MYLIQQVTKQPTDEIIGFFYDFCKEVFLVGAKNMIGQSMRKEIKFLYPGTAIPVKILVKGQKTQHTWNPQTRQYVTAPSISGIAEATFPENSSFMDTDKIVEMIVEKQLLGGSTLPDFEAPPTRTPKMYKDLIKQVLKGPKKDE